MISHTKTANNVLAHSSMILVNSSFFDMPFPIDNLATEDDGGNLMGKSTGMERMQSNTLFCGSVVLLIQFRPVPYVLYY